MTPYSESRRIRVAVVGCGYWGSKHVRVLHATEGVEEVAVVDSREDRVRSLARSYKSAPWHTALGTALDEVDAVVVATPPSTHVAVALQAIEAGKHVLVEKPLAPTSEGARDPNFSGLPDIPHVEKVLDTLQRAYGSGKKLSI